MNKPAPFTEREKTHHSESGENEGGEEEERREHRQALQPRLELRQQQRPRERRALAATGASWAGLLTTWYMETRSANVIAANPDSSSTLVGGTAFDGWTLLMGSLASSFIFK